jgi:DNA-binding CsgD family transcriptional regulator
MMKANEISTYRDYLAHLAAHPQTSSWDYGMYIREADQMKLFARQSSTLLFMLDYSTKAYPFVDQNSRQIMGYANEAFYEGGLEFVLHNNPNFRVLNLDIHRDRTEFLERNPMIDVAQLRFTMNFSFLDAKGKFRTILQRNSVIHLTDQHIPTAIFGFAWDVTEQISRNKFIQQVEQLDPETGDWQLLLSKEYYPNIDKNKLLSKREIEILKWIIEGCNSKQIADKLHVSVHTVNTHRRNMLQRTNCQNAMELLRYAVQNGIL